MQMRSLATSALVVVTGWTLAEAAEIKVIAATPMTAVVQEIGAQFEKTGRHKLIATFVSGPIVQQRIGGGELFDLAVSITPVIEALIEAGKLVPATRADLAYGLVGVGVRTG